ncbi:MAG TPA: hypothetical protein VE177_01290, partial [Candidatus Binatus sp.]|nr:hypothetical protein [Candidatus Binatus sp.]
YFYSQPLAEGQISAAQWTITIYTTADTSPNTVGLLTVDMSLYSIDGTSQSALLGSSIGNSVSTTISRLVITIQGASVPVRNGDRLTLRLHADNAGTGFNSLTIYYDGQGYEGQGDEARVQTSATKEESWRQDYEVNPFSLSSVNRYWQASNPAYVTWDSSQSYTGSHSLHISDRSGLGNIGRYDFATGNNPAQPLPPGTTLSFYTYAASNSKGAGIQSFHLQILDQGQSYEYYWYWSSSNSSIPPLAYPSASKATGTYMGTITVGSWAKHELLDWTKQAEVAFGFTFQSPSVVSVSAQATGSGAQRTDIYWDNIFVTSYTLTVQPLRSEEGQTSTLSLTVTGAIPQTAYQFEFSVTDPAAQTTNATISYTTGSTETGFTISKLYPDDFPGLEVLAGLYNVTLRQTGPVYLIPVGSSFITDYVTTRSSFTIHLADRTSYERTETVRVQATGYNASELVNVTLQGPGSASNYQFIAQADVTGLMVTTWQVPSNAGLGSYDLTIKGSTTTKKVVDHDVLVVAAAT